MFLESQKQSTLHQSCIWNSAVGPVIKYAHILHTARTHGVFVPHRIRLHFCVNRCLRDKLLFLHRKKA